MKNSNDGFSFLLDWYAANGYRPIPKVTPGVPDANTCVLKDVSSRSIILLQRAGLDIKRLPAMNNRDRGRALEMEIGL
jgi:hypothetical protein